MKFVAVTSCPTGIAHTYMAAEALEQAAADSGDEMHVETQGSAGSDPLDPQIIADADAVIFAADVEVRDRERFAGKPLVQSGVKRAIGGAAEMLDEARAAVAAGPPAGGAAPAGAAAGGGLATKVDSGAGFGTRLRGWLMTGVSYVIPFVAAGGLLIALSFALGGYEIVNGTEGHRAVRLGSLQSWAALMFQIGGIAFGFLVPILAGFIAFAMGDRPALVPGIVGGFIAVQVKAGFIGGLIAGLLAGAVVLGIRKIKVPRSVAGIMPVVVIPLVSTLIVGILMFVVLGPPLAALAAGLTNWLNGLSGANKVILGIVLGLMMGFDMGGPVNKTAYSFAALGLAAATPASFEIMAAVMAAGMTPPLGLALASVLRKNLFTHVERENGKAAWVLGASFITEGAIPFAAGDPLRVIPSLMVGVRGDRWAEHGVRVHVAGAARWHLRGAADRQPVPLPAGDPHRYRRDGLPGDHAQELPPHPGGGGGRDPGDRGRGGRLIALRIRPRRVGRRTGGPPAPSSKGVPVPERKVKVGSSVGLHARPATIFTQAAAKQPVKVTIAKAGGNAVDARSVLFVLGLDVRGGDEVVLAAEGEGAEAALDELEALTPARPRQGIAPRRRGRSARGGRPLLLSPTAGRGSRC